MIQVVRSIDGVSYSRKQVGRIIKRFERYGNADDRRKQNPSHPINQVSYNRVINALEKEDQDRMSTREINNLEDVPQKSVCRYLKQE